MAVDKRYDGLDEAVAHICDSYKINLSAKKRTEASISFKAQKREPDVKTLKDFLVEYANK